MNAERNARECANPGRQRRHAGFAVLALLAALATAPGALAQPGGADAAFDQYVFRPYRTAAGARVQLDSALSARVAEIDRVCRLTEAQKQKLRLAGRGDIKRFFDRYEQVKERFRLARDDELMQQRAMETAAPLQAALRDGLFQEGSLLYKSLQSALTDEQATRFTAGEAERHAARHRVGVERAVESLGQNASLTAAQRRNLSRLLADEIKPPRKAAPQYDLVYALYLMRRLPEGKLKPLFDAERWAKVSELLNEFRRGEPILRREGMLPDEDGEGARAVPPRPGGLEE